MNDKAITDPAAIEAAFERDQEAEDSRPAPLADPCACFPGQCRGGQVVNGRTVSGQSCRRTDEKLQADKVDERLAVGLLRAELEAVRAERDLLAAGLVIAGNFRRNASGEWEEVHERHARLPGVVKLYHSPR